MTEPLADPPSAPRPKPAAERGKDRWREPPPSPAREARGRRLDAALRKLTWALACFAAGALAVSSLGWWRRSLEPPARPPWGLVRVPASPSPAAAAPARPPAPAVPVIPTAPPIAGPLSPPPPALQTVPPIAPATGLALPTAGGARTLLLPVAGIGRDKLHDNFAESREGERMHQALDIMAPRGTPVLATDDGPVAKLFNSQKGGITLYQFDPTRTYCYYYAHLDRYADGLAEGVYVHKGDTIAYVGSTGNASPDAPHLHFQLMRLPPTAHWWEGTAINPFPYLVGP